jgi:hypothetical protein
VSEHNGRVSFYGGGGLHCRGVVGGRPPKPATAGEGRSRLHHARTNPNYVPFCLLRSQVPGLALLPRVRVHPASLLPPAAHRVRVRAQPAGPRRLLRGGGPAPHHGRVVRLLRHACVREARRRHGVVRGDREVSGGGAADPAGAAEVLEEVRGGADGGLGGGRVGRLVLLELQDGGRRLWCVRACERAKPAPSTERGANNQPSGAPTTNRAGRQQPTERGANNRAGRQQPSGAPTTERGANNRDLLRERQCLFPCARFARGVPTTSLSCANAHDLFPCARSARGTPTNLALLRERQ